MSTIAKQTVGQKVGSYVKYQREKQNLSINELGKKTSLTPSYLMRLEQGAYKTIGYDAIQKLANGFTMPREDFLYKCGLIRTRYDLPPIEYYLKEVYQFPPEAIENVKLMIELMRFKFKSEITELKKAHKKYWAEKSSKSTE